MLKGLNSLFNYALYNLSGKLIETGKKNQIRLNDRGVYLLKIQNEGQTYFKKIIF